MSAGNEAGSIRQVIIDPNATSLGPQETDPVLREHAADQVMDYLQQIGEIAVSTHDPKMLAQLSIPSRISLHPDGFRHIDSF